MTDVLKTQYALVQSSRKIVLDFIETEVGNDLHTPVAAYTGHTLRDLFVHVAYCYFQWLSSFAMKKPVKWLDNEDLNTIEHIRLLYQKIDDITAAFLEDFKYKTQPIEGIHDVVGKVSATPVELFTHVLTHEFHHKGQIMSMCRMLGHLPPETDVSLFFPDRRILSASTATHINAFL